MDYRLVDTTKKILHLISRSPGIGFNEMIKQTGLLDRGHVKTCRDTLIKSNLIEEHAAKNHKQKREYTLTPLGLELERKICDIENTADALTNFISAIMSSYLSSSGTKVTKAHMMVNGWTKKEMDWHERDFQNISKAYEALSVNLIVVIITLYLSFLVRLQSNPIAQQLMISALTEALWKSMTQAVIAGDRQEIDESMRRYAAKVTIECITNKVLSPHLLANRFVNQQVYNVIKCLYPLAWLTPKDIKSLKKDVHIRIKMKEDSYNILRKLKDEKAEKFEEFLKDIYHANSESVDRLNFEHSIIERENKRERLYAHMLLRELDAMVSSPSLSLPQSTSPSP